MPLRTSFVIPAGTPRKRQERMEWCHSQGAWGIRRLVFTLPGTAPGPIQVRIDCYCRSHEEWLDLVYTRGAYGGGAENWPTYSKPVVLDEIPPWAEGFDRPGTSRLAQAQAVVHTRGQCGAMVPLSAADTEPSLCAGPGSHTGTHSQYPSVAISAVLGGRP